MSQNANRKTQTMRISTTGESAERGRKGDAWIESKIVPRREDYEGSVSLSRFLSPRRCAGFPRGTFAMDRYRCRTCATGRTDAPLQKYRAYR